MQGSPFLSYQCNQESLQFVDCDWLDEVAILTRLFRLFPVIVLSLPGQCDDLNFRLDSTCSLNANLCFVA